MALNANTPTNRNRVRYTVTRNAAASKMSDKDVYTARVDTASPYNLDMIAEAMAKGRFPYSKEDVIHVLTTFCSHAQDLLKSGVSVNVGGLVFLRPTIKGTFENESDGYDAAKNQLRVKASVGSALRYATAEALVEKFGDAAFPVISEMYNTVDGLADVLYSNAHATIEGENLAFDAGAEDEGLFVQTPDGDTIKITPVSATAERILFLMPITYDAETSANLYFKTRMGDAARKTPVMLTQPFTGKPAQ